MTPIKTALTPLIAKCVRGNLPPPQLRLWLPGKVVPKARPRVARGRAYLPSAYRQWKQDAIVELLSQLSQLGSCARAALPLNKASVEIVLTGAMRGDLDNLSGGVLDVLVESGILQDDRLSCLPRLLVTHTKKGESGAAIKVESC